MLAQRTARDFGQAELRSRQSMGRGRTTLSMRATMESWDAGEADKSYYIS
jgi:hypothetical protein